MVESVHHAAACAVDPTGAVIFAAGDIDTPVFLRSSAKPFIAATVIAAGAQERFGLDEREIAVMAASHAGQPFHVDAVRSILRKIGMQESDLLCGPHAPYNAAAAQELEQSGSVPGPVHNNCSGKHAGILALCKILGADPATYLEPLNPAQQRILQFCARISGMKLADLRIGVDGCGIPVYAAPLRSSAAAFMHFATLTGAEQHEVQAMQTVRSAMIAYPEYVAGTGEFDTRFMEAANGIVACKSGAEGVQGAALLDSGVGLIVKVLDGASRGRGPAVLTILRRLGLVDGVTLTKLADLEHPVVYNRAGRAVGEVRAAGVLAVRNVSTG
jgi:L-asparaginase II